MNSNRILVGSLSFLLSATALVLVLKVVNWLPLAVQKDTLREYGSIEQVKSALKFQTIYIPSYFPESIGWPPSKILAQDRPFPALVMEFRRTGMEQVVLILSQSRGGTLSIRNSLEPSVVKENVPFLLHDRTAVLIVGTCENQDPCSRITWTEGEYTISVSMRSAPIELTRIASSMLP